MNDDELRALGPAGLPPDRRAALREALLREVAASGEPTEATGPAAPGERAEPTEPAPSLPLTPVSRRPRWWILAAAALVGVVAIAALVVSNDAPVEERVETTEPDDGTISVEVPDDFRPQLEAELVRCIRRPITMVNAFDTYAGQVPLDDPLGADDPYEACEAKVVRPGNARGPLSTETCRDPSERFPTPIVLLGFERCADRDLVPLTAADRAELDEARAIEARLQAITVECASRQLATRWVEQELAATEVDLALVTTPGEDEADDACFGPVVSWPTATVTIEEIAGD